MAKKSTRKEPVSPPPVEPAPPPQNKRIARATPKPAPAPVVVEAPPPPPPPPPAPKPPKAKRPRFVRPQPEKRTEAGVVNDLVRSTKPAGKLLTKNLKLAPDENARGHHDPKKDFG